MQRYGRVLKLKKGKEATYEAYHRKVWPAVLKAGRQSGIRNYTIFRYRRWLFSYFELPDGLTLEKIGEKITANPACRRWEQLMHRLQERLPESKGENWWVPIKEIYHS